MSQEDNEQAENHRICIRKIAINSIFSLRGGENMNSIKGTDIRELFGLYDKFFFNEEISKKLLDIGGGIKFVASSRTIGTLGICGKEKECKYYMEIAPQLLGNIDRIYKDRLECLQAVMECLIIHLIMLLWGFAEKNDDVYSEHGKLFCCMSLKYFGHKSGIERLTSINIECETNEASVSPSFNPKGMYSWHANSCYMDSLLMILFDSAGQFWRDELLHRNIDEITYSTVNGVCDLKGGSRIDTIDKLKKHAKKIQDQLVSDFLELNKKGDIIRCNSLRNMLYECFPNMKSGENWLFYNVAASYDLISEIFPNLKTEYPVKTHRWKDGHYSPEPSTRTKTMATMWDYIDPLDNIEKNKDYDEIMWDQIDSPVIVFYNGGTPRIKKFNEAGKEKGLISMTGDRGTYNRYQYELTKARAFGETIIDGKYELVGVITLHGVSPNQEEGVHYTSYFKTYDDERPQWWYYDDSCRVIRKIDNLPQAGVWIESGGKMPSMYFYRAIKNIPKMEEVNGSHLTIKIQHTDKKDDLITIFVKDKTDKAKYVKFMINKLNPTSKVSENTVCWKISLTEFETLSDSLSELDSTDL